MGLTHFNGLSVTGSGLYAGGKNLEVGPIIAASGYIMSGWVTGSSILTGAIRIDHLAATGNVKLDSGTFGWSGALRIALSTRLTTINFAQATPVRTVSEAVPQATSIVAFTNFSGHAIDFRMMYLNASANLVSAETSSQIAWMAIGN